MLPHRCLDGIGIGTQPDKVFPVRSRTEKTAEPVGKAKQERSYYSRSQGIILPNIGVPGSRRLMPAAIIEPDLMLHVELAGVRIAEMPEATLAARPSLARLVEK